MGWGGAVPPSGGRGCPPGEGAWGSKNSESLSQERTEAIARASTVDKSMLAFDFWRHSNNKQSAGYRLRHPQGSFPLSSPPFTPSHHLPTPRHHPIDHQRLPDDARSSSCCLKLLLGAIARGCCSRHRATRRRSSLTLSALVVSWSVTFNHAVTLHTPNSTRVSQRKRH